MNLKITGFEWNKSLGKLVESNESKLAKKMSLDPWLERWENHEWDPMGSRTMALSTLERRIKRDPQPFTKKFQIIVLLSRIFGCHPHAIFTEKIVKTTKLQKFYSIICSLITLLSAAYLIHTLLNNESKRKDKNIIYLCRVLRTVAILMSWFICGLMAVIRARNFENAIAAIQKFDRATNFRIKTNIAYGFVVTILVLSTWSLIAVSVSSTPYERNVPLEMIAPYKIVCAIPFGVMSLEIYKFCLIFVNLLKRFVRYNNIVSTGNLSIHSIKGVYYQPLTVRDAFILRHWLTDSLNNFNKYYDVQIVYWFTLTTANLIVQVFSLISNSMQSLVASQIITLFLTIYHPAIICVICHFTCDEANESGKLIFGHGGTSLKTTVSALESLEFGFYVFRNPIRIMGMGLFCVNLPLIHSIFQASVTYATFLLQNKVGYHN